MNPNFATCEEKVEAILKLALADVIEDIHLLTVALCLSTMKEIMQTLDIATDGDYRHIAAHRAKDLKCNPVKREIKATEGYFAEGICGLLNLASQRPDVGSRLVPIFYNVLQEADGIGIPPVLKRKTICRIEHILQRDGFAIIYIGENGDFAVKSTKVV